MNHWECDVPHVQLRHLASGEGGAENREGLSRAFVRGDVGGKTLPYKEDRILDYDFCHAEGF